jgi:hypothetical protein
MGTEMPASKEASIQSLVTVDQMCDLCYTGQFSEFLKIFTYLVIYPSAD